MPTAKELREKRAPIAAVIKKMGDDGSAVSADGSFTPEWVKVNDEYNALSKQIDVAESVARVTADQGRIDDWRSQIGREDADGRTNRELTTSRSGFAARRKEKIDREAAALKDAGFENLDEARTMAMAAWFSEQSGKYLSDDMVAACQLLQFNPRAKEIAMPLADTESFRGMQTAFGSVNRNAAADHVRDYKATLSIGSGPSGGYLIPPETLIRELEINMLYYGGMRQAAETIRTATGERMSWPTADDTTNAGAQLGENTTIGSSVDPTFAKVYWDAYKFSSKPCLVPYELIQDSVFNLPRLLGEMFGIRLGRITNTKFTVGTGAATPMGLISKLVNIGQDTLSYSAGYAKGFIKSKTAGTITYDDVLNLKHSVDPAYRKNPGFMCHDQILLYFRQLKDGIGRPLWQSNIRDGMPDTLDGDRITINQDMDGSVATGKNALVYGDLSHYKIRTVGATRMYRLEERYRDTDQDGFIAFLREDGNLLYAGNLPIKLLQVT